MGKLDNLPKWVKIALPSLAIVVWMAAAAIGGPYFGKIGDVSSTDLSTFLPDSAESTKVNEDLSKFRDQKNIPVLAVFDKNDVQLTDEQRGNIRTVANELGKVEGVQPGVAPPVVSRDGKAAFIIIPLDSGGDFKNIFAGLTEKLNAANLSVDYKLTGPASFARDLQGAFAGIDGTLLLVALAAVFVILLVVYRSPFLPVIVLVTAMAALSVAIVIVYQLAQSGLIELNGQVQGILFILVIGAATDYSLLYIARYREELHRFEAAWAATKAAVKASYEPILAAGGTVAAGLMCLLFSDLGSNKALGPVGGIGIALSVIAALTFLPACLLLLGRFGFWPRTPHYDPDASNESYRVQHSVWKKIGDLIGRHPRRIWMGSLVVLLVACLGFTQLKAQGVSQSELILGYSEAREGQKVLDKHFAAGSGSPTYIVVGQQNIEKVVAALDVNDKISAVSAFSDNSVSGSLPLGKYKTSLQATGQIAPFVNATPKIVEGKAMLQVTLNDPADSLAARQTIVAIRKDIKQVDQEALVGGVSAVQYDTNQASLRDQKVLIPLILVAITLILMMLLRSVVAPIILLLTTVVSFGATLGISALLFNHLWHFPGADPSVVIFGFVFLVALGIDYNIFLMTRVREETLRLGVRAGTIKGLVVTGAVITSAGIVLAATFAALSVIPILFLAQIAFVVAFGVLLDTILVRSLLVPSLTLELGKAMWWPSRRMKHRKQSSTK